MQNFCQYTFPPKNICVYVTQYSLYLSPDKYDILIQNSGNLKMSLPSDVTQVQCLTAEYTGFKPDPAW
jgi:hypothetical protein